MIDISQAMKDNADVINDLHTKFMEDKFQPIKNIYIDINCLKDLRMGLMIALSSKTRLEFLKSGLERYNRRPDRSFTFAYPGFPYSEEQLTQFYFKDHVKQREAFNYAPDTVLSLYLGQIINNCRRANCRCEYTGRITVTINSYPFQPGVLFNVYRVLLSTIYQNLEVDFKIICSDPGKLGADFWKNHTLQFFDDFRLTQKNDSGWVQACFRDNAMRGTYVFAALCADEKVRDKWDKTIDWNNPEAVQEYFSCTELVYNLACNFNFTSFGIPTQENYAEFKQSENNSEGN